MTTAQDTIHVRLDAASHLYDRNHPAFLEEVLELRRELATPGVRVVEDAGEGTKGAAEVTAVIGLLAAGGSGLTALCGVVKHWLTRRGHRAIRLTVRHEDASESVLEIDGTNVTDETLLAFVKDATRHVR